PGWSRKRSSVRLCGVPADGPLATPGIAIPNQGCPGSIRDFRPPSLWFEDLPDRLPALRHVPDGTLDVAYQIAEAFILCRGSSELLPFRTLQTRKDWRLAAGVSWILAIGVNFSVAGNERKLWISA